MIEFLLIVAAIVALHFLRKWWRFKPLTPLLPKQYNFGKRRNTLRQTLELLEQRQAKTLVETGVARNGLAQTKGDGASTIVFSLWASQHDAHLYSVDIDPAAVELAQSVIDEMKLSAQATLNVSDSVAYLESFEPSVDFLYLDSYDYSKRDVAIQEASQLHHLNEFKAIESRLHDQTVVLIDDCNLPGGGKGKTVIDYMQQQGWTLLRYDYQALLVKKPSE